MTEYRAGYLEPLLFNEVDDNFRGKENSLGTPTSGVESFSEALEADHTGFDIVRTGYHTSQSAGGGSYYIRSGGSGAPSSGIGAIFYDSTGSEFTLKGDLYPEKFGAIGDGIHDDTDSLNRVISHAKNKSETLYLRAKAYRFTSKLSFDGQMKVEGVFNNVTGSINSGTVLLKDGDFDGVEITSKVDMTNLSIFGASGNGGCGLVLSGGGRSNIASISVHDHGSHGIYLITGNLTSFRDLSLLRNGGDGMRMEGSVPPDCNACVFSNVDSRDNAGNGINISRCWQPFGNFTTQHNGMAGVLINECRGGNIQIYSESNASQDIYLTSHTDCSGSFIHALFADTVLNDSGDKNIVIKSRNGSSYSPKIGSLPTDKIIFPSYETVGRMTMGKSQSLDRVYNVRFDSTGQKQTIVYKNIGGISNPDIDDAVNPFFIEMNGGSHSRVPYTLEVDSSSPRVDMSELYYAENTTSTLITNFSGTNYALGKIVHVFAKNSNTTIRQATSSSVGFLLKGGADRAVPVNEVISFICVGQYLYAEI